MERTGKYFVLLLLLTVFFNLSCGSKKTVNSSENNLFVIANVVKGKVEYQLPAQKGWKIAKVGDKFPESTMIRVSNNGFLVLEYPGKYKTSIAGGTELSIKKLQPAKKKGFFSTVFAVLKGMVYSSVTINTKKGDSYEVETPQAVCGVYGTIFVVGCDEETGKTKLYVEEHVVTVRARNQSLNKAKRIKAGYMVVIQNGNVGNPQPFNAVQPPYANIFGNGLRMDKTLDRGDIKVDNH